MKTCPVCQTPVIGRSDKKFCSDDCRASYHNEKNRISNKKIQIVNRILRRNRRILSYLLQSNFETVSKSILEDMGFEFEYYTRELTEEEKGTKLCYDISFRMVEEEKGQVVYIKSEKNNIVLKY